MGRTVIERPKKEIAAFLENPESACIYDKYIVVMTTLDFWLYIVNSIIFSSRNLGIFRNCQSQILTRMLLVSVAPL